MTIWRIFNTDDDHESGLTAKELKRVEDLYQKATTNREKKGLAPKLCHLMEDDHPLFKAVRTYERRIMELKEDGVELFDVKINVKISYSEALDE